MGADQALGSKFFQNHKSLVHFPISFKFFPSNDIIFVELLSLMLHAKFQNHRPSGSREEDFLKFFAIYSHGGHLGYVT